MTLDELRVQIDELDARLLELLNERARRAVEIGKIKESTNSACYVPEREKVVFDRLRKLNKGPLSNEAVIPIFREIISAIRALERMVSVAFLGPRDSFSHMAALRIFGSRAEYHPLSTLDDIFTEVERRRIDYGIVPVESSMGGGVSDTLDRFLTSDLKIINEVLLHITMNLMARGPLATIQRVYSKDQSFIQCRNWLKANLPGAELIPSSSTSEAARIASEDPESAAIASELAAKTYNLKILAPCIEDSPQNYTRFFVVSRQMAKRTGHDKTALLFSIKDAPGALYKLLKPLAEAGVNLTKIESRPSKKRAWEYVFFVDLLGHIEDPGVKEALDKVSAYCDTLRILGSFPVGEVED